MVAISCEFKSRPAHHEPFAKILIEFLPRFMAQPLQFLRMVNALNLTNIVRNGLGQKHKEQTMKILSLLLITILIYIPMSFAQQSNDRDTYQPSWQPKQALETEEELTEEEIEQRKKETERIMRQQKSLENINKQLEINRMQQSLDNIKKINEFNQQRRNIEEINKINQMQKTLDDIRRLNQQNP